MGKESKMRGFIELAKNQTRNDSPLLKGVADRRENFSTDIESRLPLARWLHGLEVSERLIQHEAKTSRNIAWAKGVLARWRAAGYPNPELWPEIQRSEWLHPSYSLNHNEWPNL
ncbi:MAG: hypothetical protein ABSE48_21965 [Verrucomicrobiota bacterium]|jgi:hypothetical protein